MSTNRIGRINEEIQRELSELLRNVKDPRVQKTMISITRVQTTPDLRYAKVWFSVLDKDLASALCANAIGADAFYILTDVPKVYINFRQPNQQALDTITVAQAKEYLAQGQFTEGSMAPKVRAGILFVENGGTECIITEAGRLGDPACGTRIIK